MSIHFETRNIKLSKVRLVCPTCGEEIEEAKGTGSVTCGSCGLAVTPIATSKAGARPLARKEKEDKPEYEPLINERDYRPVKLILKILGWLLVLAGITVFGLMILFPKLPADVGSRPFLFSVYGTILLVLGVVSLVAKWRLTKHLEPAPPSRFS